MKTSNGQGVSELAVTDERISPVGYVQPNDLLKLAKGKIVSADIYPSAGYPNTAPIFTALQCFPAAPAMTAEEQPTGQVYGIIDPDYGRIYTMIRKLAWDEGYAIGLHGSFTRDLDMIAVPWADRVCTPEKLIRRIIVATGLRALHGEQYDPEKPGQVDTGKSFTKPHGRLTWTLMLPEFGDPRFVDLSVMPAEPVKMAPEIVRAG